MGRLLAYWKKQLADAPLALNLPTDQPRPATPTYQTGHQSLALSPSLFKSLERLSQQADVTLFMTLLAAFQTLLHRYTGQDDIVLGLPIAGRGQIETQELIGCSVNTLVLRTNLAGNPTFWQLLERVRETALGAYAHQDLPFEKLVEILQPDRDMSRSSLFQVLFALQNTSGEERVLPGLKVSRVETEREMVKFDLSLTVFERSEGLTGIFEYNMDLFDAVTIERMAGHFQTLVEGIVFNPEQRLSDLPILAEAEGYQILVEWNDTETDYPRTECIHELFEAQVERRPEAVAVIFEDQQLTYAELNRRANQLAHHLRELGIGPEVLVGICVERSLEMVVGILGILKAGGAYLPLDPAYPQERLAFMLADTKAPVLLTQAHLAEVLPQHQAQLVCLDMDWQTIAQASTDNLANNVTTNNLAYVMYTSGSTGRPKGISIIHRSIVRLVKKTNYAKLTEAEIFLQYAPISFDAATLELWGSLLNGGLLVVPPAQTLSLEELGQILQRYRVTTLWLTAGLFHLMVDQQLENLKNVRQLLAGGDVLSVPHVKKFLETLGGCTLINGYGPTENTTFTCCYPMTDVSQIGASVSIGRPIANTQVYILDRYLRPVPVGVPGELYIGGNGLARDYFNRPELTAEKFIPHPFSDKPGDRLYKTGDLVRFLPNSNIEFFGRIDHQVKIRGFRIELGEIETALGQHPAVREAVVVVREDQPGDKHLVAYIVCDVEKVPASRELRSYLKEKLPDYMVPTTFMLLKTLLLTPNGKIDRRVLPAPEILRPELGETFVPPRNPIEGMIAAIWAKVLGLEQVGVYDNFFELGGHSLLATQVISHLRHTFQFDLPFRSLFEAPTVADLAERLEVVRWATQVSLSSDRMHQDEYEEIEL